MHDCVAYAMNRNVRGFLHEHCIVYLYIHVAEALSPRIIALVRLKLDARSNGSVDLMFYCRFISAKTD